MEDVIATKRGTIRQAKPEDQDRLVEMALRFLSSTRYGVFIRGVTVESMQAFVDLVRQAGVIFVAETEAGLVGMLGILIIQHPMSGLLEAGEVAWWIEPEHRSGMLGYHLLRAAEDWTRQKGVGCLKMVAPADSTTGTFYERMGYSAVETTYQKFFDVRPASSVN